MPEIPIHKSLSDFVAFLEQRGQLTRITRPVSVVHEMTEIHRRVLAENGPALLFTRPTDGEGNACGMPVLTNLFGTVERIAWGLRRAPGELEALGEHLAGLSRPRAPKSLGDAVAQIPVARAALSMGVRTSGWPAGKHRFVANEDVDLSTLPIQWCWPGEPAGLITWPLVITRSPTDPNDVNVGIYRMQVTGRRSLIVRWLANRGGARHFRAWQATGQDMPVAVVIGADPATLLAAVMPIPDGMSELSFSGLLRGRRGSVMTGRSVDLPVPASAEIVIEGHVSIQETHEEGPFGDHTGYYNAVERFPTVTLSAMAVPKKPFYLSTYTGRPPDEPSRLGEALNALFVPLVKREFPEIHDLWLPPEACSYRAMIVSINKRYEGQARRVMMGLWSVLPQFSYCKMIFVVDRDINVRSWPDVIWALSTRFEAPRDLMVVENTPMDYLDFSTVRQGLGTKLGFDATNKVGTESDRAWGVPLTMSADVRGRVDEMWSSLGLGIDAL